MRLTIALLAILFIPRSIQGTAAETVTIRPARDDAMLLNPGKGWVQYYGTDKYTKDYISVGYTRWAWSVLEPKEGRFNWKAIDDFIRQFKQIRQEDCLRRDERQHGLGRQYVTPKWVFDAGAGAACRSRRLIPTGQQIIPEDLGRPGLPAKLKAFVRALGKRYDGHPDIAFLDIRSYGNWGEGHIGMLKAPGIVLTPPGQPQEQLLSALRQGLSPYPAHHSLGQRPLQFRLRLGGQPGCRHARDGILSEWSKDGSECLRAHGRHPAVFEYCDGYDDMKKKGWWKPDVLKNTYFNGGKPSYMQWNPQIFEENRDFCLSLGNHVGYHFVLQEAVLPGSLPPSGRFHLEFQWLNDGVAYLYEPCQVAVALLNGDNKVVRKQWLAESHPRSWARDRPRGKPVMSHSRLIKQILTSWQSDSS